ncbi:MAG TPA: IS630 family transposase [Anaerolineales bacterium]|nr:IS630 family transposase [Anaerolineales bacterium]
MEERRLQGGRLLKAGKLSQAEIAHQLGVSRATVSEWAKTVQENGISGLRKRKAVGGVSKLTEEQKQKLKRLLDRGALACGFETDCWTLQRVAELIEREFQVVYHPNYLSRLLAKLGFSWQLPMPQAIEQDRALVQAWLERDLPRVKKLAAARRRNSVLG